jgi:hypothetical protein
VSGCADAASGYSTLCRQHKQVQRRHGSPTQAGVTSQELKPCIALVEARKVKNPSSAVWSILTARWGLVVDASMGTLKRYSEGQASQGTAVLAAGHIRNLSESAEPWEVIRTVVAMFVLQEQQPRRFESDAAFDFQLVRRVLRLSPANAGAYWDHKEQRSKRVYRDVPPSVIRSLSVPLKEAFGATGLMLAAKEREEALRGADERKRLSTALGDLQ